MNPALIAQAVAALCVVLALVLLAGRAARLRPNNAGAPNALRLAATLALDPRRRLHLVQTETGQLLILTGANTETMLPWPPPARP